MRAGLLHQAENSRALTDKLAVARATPTGIMRGAAVVGRMLRGGRGSLAVAIGVVLAGVWVLPVHLGGGTATALWQVPTGAPRLAVGTELPVFCMPRGGAAARCGIARVSSPTHIAFTAYGNAVAGLRRVPVLAASDMGLLWALGDPGGKLELRDSAAALARQVVSDIGDLTQSPLWQREYRPVTNALLDRVAARAWNAPDTQRALRNLVIAIEPVARQSFSEEVGPVLGSYMAEAFWRVLTSNSRQVFSLITGSPPDLSALGRALSAALRDPAIQPALARLGPRLLALPQTKLLIERFITHLAEAVQSDPDIFGVLSRIASDPRLGQGAGNVRANAGEFVRNVGQILWGIGNNQSLNSLAGLALKSTIAGTSQPLILLLDPESSLDLEQAMPGGVTLLITRNLP